MYITQHVVRYNNIGPFVTNTFKYFGSTVHELVDNLVKEKIEDDEKLKRLKKYMNEQDIEVYPVCAVSGEGLHELLERVWTLIGEYEPEADDSDEEVLYKPEVKADFEVSRDDDGAFVITGMRIERLVAMTNFDDDQSVRRFQRIWRYMELDKMLKEAGIEDGDTVRIYSTEFEYHQ